jgi:hypothetical protein
MCGVDVPCPSCVISSLLQFVKKLKFNLFPACSVISRFIQNIKNFIRFFFGGGVVLDFTNLNQNLKLRTLKLTSLRH